MNPVHRALRTHGEEILDALDGSDPVAQGILADLERWNRLSGWTRRHVAMVQRHWEAQGRPEPFRVLDVGTGRGALLEAIADHLDGLGVEAELVGLDLSEGYVASARERLGARARILQGDATALPFEDGAFHLGTNALMVHHLPQALRGRVVAELGRTCRAVYLFDLELTLYGTIGFALGATLLRMQPETRHDGVLSVRRGSTFAEFEALTAELPGRAVRVFPSALAVVPG